MVELTLEARQARYRYPRADADAVRGVDLTVSGGELVGVVGPNGSGKTTLLRLLLGLVRPSGGSVAIQGKLAHEWRRRALARVVAVVAQREEPLFPLRVHQAVLLGRYPHLGALGTPRGRDLDEVQRALARCDVEALADRWVATLSGGEWQRVRIARALAQEPRALVLDEATANLDVRHEMETFELVARLVRETGITAIVVTHHVNLAARFVDRMLVLDKGEPRASGPPAEVLTRAVLEQVFQWPVAVTEWRGTPQVVPLRRSESGETRDDRPAPP